jgi:uncharacterized OB-fold protein
MTQVSPPTARPADWVRDGETWLLLASRCPGCGNRAFPATDFCHVCAGAEPPVVERIPARGTVYSRTTIFTAPAEFPTPYVLAYVDLDDGPRVLGRLTDQDPPAAIGDVVRGVPSVVGGTPGGEQFEALVFTGGRAEG